MAAFNAMDLQWVLAEVSDLLIKATSTDIMTGIMTVILDTSIILTVVSIKATFLVDGETGETTTLGI